MRRRRGLTEEDARLWAGVARQARPLPGKQLPDVGGADSTEPVKPATIKVGRRAEALAKALKAAMGLEATPHQPPVTDAALRRTTARMADALHAAPTRPSLMPAYQAPPQGKAAGGKAASARRTTDVPALHPIEKPVKRKLGAGRVAIEDRIDLHDKTQIVAHYALLAFLRGAQAQGLRHVLVITGRGASFGSRGVIKRSLPHWFGTPEFRGLVAGFEPAERHHGGDGAFYVRVRRR